MKPRHRRIAIVAGGVAAIAIAAALVLNAFQSNVVFFFTPSQVAAGEAPKGRAFRIGGLVKNGTLVRKEMTLHFVVTDTAREIAVAYTGIAPDLFREGRGVVAQGVIGDDGTFVASEILAKHDENYMPPDAKHAIDSAQKTVKQ
jgi:cytochrome c-type biogenesis protein CcmE